MPEFPDFDRIARRVLQGRLVRETGQGDGTIIDDAWWRTVHGDLAEQLRQVWNLRGACDIAAIDEVAHTNETAVEAAIEQLNRA